MGTDTHHTQDRIDNMPPDTKHRVPNGYLQVALYTGFIQQDSSLYDECGRPTTVVSDQANGPSLPPRQFYLSVSAEMVLQTQWHHSNRE